MLDRIAKISSCLIVIFVLSACSKTFKVVAYIPQPLIEPSPVTATINYSDDFKNYKFLEKSDDRSLESVEFGSAQVSLFDQIFSTLFNLTDGVSASSDIKIEPQILDFQYSAPKETKLNLYEVWVKYRLKITDRKDEELADWVVKGYGKTPTSMLSSHLKAFNVAANIALRDVGAQLAIGFRKQPSIKDYLAMLAGAKPGSAEEAADSTAIDKETAGPLPEGTNGQLAQANVITEADTTQPASAPVSNGDKAIESTSPVQKTDSISEELP